MRPKILIVDDEPRICESVKLLFVHLQYEIHTSNSGKDAIARISEHAFDLVLLDIFMPEVDGYQVLDHIKRWRPDITVIMMTGRASVETVVTALRKGVYDYLQKPIDPDALFNTVKNALDFKRLKEERRRAEKALRESEEKYRQVFESTGVATVLIQRDMTIIRANAKAQLLTGYSREEIEDRMKLTDVIPVEECQHICNWQLDKSNTDEICPAEYECRLVDRSGVIKKVIIQINQLCGTDKNIASITDLTSRKRTEEPLKENEHRYKTLIDKMNEGLVEVDANWSMTFVNNRFTEMIGLSADKLIGRVFYDLVSEDTKAKAQEKHAHRSKGETRVCELELVRADKEKIFVLCSPKPTFDSDGNYLGGLGVVADITERKLAEQALQKEKDRLTDALAKTKKLSGMLPICSSCKKIRDDKGYWNQIESYIRNHSEAEFSHGICPECAKKLYPNLALYDDYE
jgi:PAS domain S-box-containing protein